MHLFASAASFFCSEDSTRLMPTTVSPSLIGMVTIAAAPTTTSLPRGMSPRIIAPAPILTRFLTCQTAIDRLKTRTTGTDRRTRTQLSQKEEGKKPASHDEDTGETQDANRRVGPQERVRIPSDACRTSLSSPSPQASLHGVCSNGDQWMLSHRSQPERQRFTPVQISSRQRVHSTHIKERLLSHTSKKTCYTVTQFSLDRFMKTCVQQRQSMDVAMIENQCMRAE